MVPVFQNFCLCVLYYSAIDICIKPCTLAQPIWGFFCHEYKKPCAAGFWKKIESCISSGVTLLISGVTPLLQILDHRARHVDSTAAAVGQQQWRLPTWPQFHNEYTCMHHFICSQSWYRCILYTIATYVQLSSSKNLVKSGDCDIQSEKFAVG